MYIKIFVMGVLLIVFRVCVCVCVCVGGGDYFNPL